MREWSDEHQDYVNVVNDANALVYLVQYGQTERVRELIEKGCNVNAADEDGVTPACMAAKINDFEMLRMLADAGADLAARCAAGPAPIFWARSNGNELMVDYISERLARAGDCPPEPA